MLLINFSQMEETIQTTQTVKMMKKTALLLVTGILIGGMANPAMAAEGGRDVVVKLTAQKVVRAKDGTETLVNADPAPGDTVEYRVVYTNQGKAPVRQVQAVLPVPAPDMEYLADSSLPANASASTDGKTFAPIPLKREVTGPDGSRRWEAVPLDQYRVLRWDLGDMSPGKSITVSSRMKLKTDTDTRQAGK
jgi:uncharacterized repeat protein (TIGR01451 family)